MTYEKPDVWTDPANKMFQHQVGFTSPPFDFDAAPTDFLRISPPTVGAHGRMLHLEGYEHALSDRAANRHLLEEVAECMANNGADVIGQVGTNWVHAGGTDETDIREFTRRLSYTYDTPFHMAGLTLVDAARELGASRVALNSVYYWPDWRDGLAGFLRSADLDVQYVGNFVDLGLYDSQDQVNDRRWIFPEAHAVESVIRTAEQAPDAEVIMINGMANWRRDDGITQRCIGHIDAMEAAVGKPVIASDTTLYWAIFKTLGAKPTHAPGELMGRLL